jgi:Spy/CpxP family protein refolding chaperone
MTNLREKQEKLQQTMNSSTPLDVKAAEQLMREVGELHTELNLINLQMKVEIESLFTPEQAAKIKAMFGPPPKSSEARGGCCSSGEGGCGSGGCGREPSASTDANGKSSTVKPKIWQEEIGLTPTQQKKLEALQQRFATTAKSLSQKAQAKRKDLMTLMLQPNASRVRAVQLVKEQKALETQLQLLGVNYRFDFQDILTKAQRAKLVALRSSGGGCGCSGGGSPDCIIVTGSQQGGAAPSAGAPPGTR